MLGQEPADTAFNLFLDQGWLFSGFAMFLIDLAIAKLGHPEELWAEFLTLWLDTLD